MPNSLFLLLQNLLHLRRAEGRGRGRGREENQRDGIGWDDRETRAIDRSRRIILRKAALKISALYTTITQPCEQPARLPACLPTFLRSKESSENETVKPSESYKSRIERK